MNKLTLAFALGTGLTLSLAVPTVKADPIINTLTTPSISASDFSKDFTPISNAPAMTSNFQLYGASNPVTGVMQSQVFQGTGAYAGLYGYAYQVSVSPNVTSSSTGGAPVHLDGTSFVFNGTPVGADLTGSGTKSSAYLITNGPIGSMTAPLNGTTGVAPNSLSWQADNYGTATDPKYAGTLRANFVNTGAMVPPLNSGSDSATFVVLTNQPYAQNFVNVTSNTPQTGGMTSVYAANGTVISPSPVPEPTTILAWAGMAGAVALVRRVRKGRTPIA
jgi:hypothetical protein